MEICVISSPIGTFTLEADEGKLTRVHFTPGRSTAAPTSPILLRAAKELKEYFRGERRRFTVPVSHGRITPFRRSVLAALRRVGYGRTVTYGELADRAGYPGSARAVGSVMSSNRLPLIYPCHRVVAAGEKPGGFGMGLPAKQALLELEGGSLPGGKR